MDRRTYVAEHIARQIARNKTRLHFSRLHESALSDFEKEVINMAASVTTTGLNAGDDRNERLQARAQSLLDPKSQQANATTPVSTIGAKMGVDSYRAQPSSLAVNSGQGDGLATDSVVSDMPLAASVKQVDYKTIEGCFPGDHRTVGKPAVLPTMPNVRGDMKQQDSSKHLPQEPLPFRSSTEFSEGERA